MIANIKAYDTILINNLRVSCILGMLPKERISPQTVVFNVELYTDFSAVAVSNDIKDTINYAEVAELIEQTSIDIKAEMVEFLAAKIIEKLQAKYSSALFGLKMEILKPEIMPNTSSVGICVTRMFKDDPNE